MGKVVILGGNARSGKSTVAYELVKHGYSRISLDNLEQYISEGLSIEFDKLDFKTKFNFFEVIVNKAIEESTNEDTNIVIDMYDYLPGDINKLKNKDKTEIYFLAYPSCTKDEIKYNIIHYSKPTDWIAQVDEEYLNSCVDRFYDRNILLVDECKKYDFELIDTKSGNNRINVLNELINRIIK